MDIPDLPTLSLRLVLVIYPPPATANTITNVLSAVSVALQQTDLNPPDLSPPLVFVSRRPKLYSSYLSVTC